MSMIKAATLANQVVLWVARHLDWIEDVSST